MEHSENLHELGEALANVQQQVEHVVRDAKNPYFKSEYTTLTSVWKTLKEVLPKHGLSVIQTIGRVTTEDNASVFENIEERETVGDIVKVKEKTRSKSITLVEVTTMLLHKSGQWVRDTQDVPLTKVDAQGTGAAITYGRRYGLAAICGLCPELDDDGETAVGRGAYQDKYVQENNVATPEEQDNYKHDKKAMLDTIKELSKNIGLGKEEVAKLTGKESLSRCGLDTLEEVLVYLADLSERKESGNLTDQESAVFNKEVTHV